MAEKITIGGEKATFEELCNAWGIVPVPDNLLRSAACCMCSPEFKNRKLYTLEPGFTGRTTRQYEEWARRVEQNCYCKYHAIEMYKD